VNSSSQMPNTLRTSTFNGTENVILRIYPVVRPGIFVVSSV